MKSTQIHCTLSLAGNHEFTSVICDSTSRPRAFSTRTWSGDLRTPLGKGTPKVTSAPFTARFTVRGSVAAEVVPAERNAAKRSAVSAKKRMEAGSFRCCEGFIPPGSQRLPESRKSTGSYEPENRGQKKRASEEALPSRLGR